MKVKPSVIIYLTVLSVVNTFAYYSLVVIFGCGVTKLNNEVLHQRVFVEQCGLKVF